MRLFYVLGMLSAVCLAFGAENSVRKIPNSLYLTPETTLRAAQGELLLFLDDPMRKVQPFVWQTTASGEIAFTTAEQGCRFTLIAKQQNSETIGKYAILSVTAENLISSNVKVTFWIAWRPSRAIQFSPGSPFGISLENELHTKSPWIPDPFIWNDKAAWYFQDRSFFEDGNLIYQTMTSDAWERDIWVRRIDLPYQDMQPGGVIGFTRYQIQLPSGEKASFEVYVPFTPQPDIQFHPDNT